MAWRRRIVWSRKLREFRLSVKALASTRHPIAAHVIPIRRCNLACKYCNEFDDFSPPVPAGEMLRRIDRLADLGLSILTFSGGEPLLHPDLDTLIRRIRERGMMAGLALNPGTPVAHLEEVVEDVDLVLVMSVNPGFGGQSYIPASTRKIERVRQVLERGRSPAALEVDGGITVETIRTAWAAGADTFVAGTAVFGARDPAAAIRALRAQCSVSV